MMKKIVLILALILFSTFNAHAQTFQATVNRSEIPEGETFLLSLDLNGAKTNNTPELKVLDKDFTVYSVSNAYRTNIVNGNMTQSRQWNLVLMPKNTGMLTIPSITLDSYQSEPIEIKVAKAGEQVGISNPANPAEPRFKIDGSIDNTNPYVQQQVNYTLTLYDTGGLQGDEPEFMVNNDDWIIKNLGSPSITSKVVNGKTVREIKFFYAFFPQKSGQLTIPAVKFNGFYLTKESRKDPFGGIFTDDMFISGFGMSDVFAARNPVVLSAKAIPIDVKPAAPENNGNWWLPATDVKLYAQFEPAQPVFKVGEAVNRTIYLKATGVIDTQLPEIKFTEIADLKQYPEKPQSKMTVENGQVVSLEKISNVYLPGKEGPMTLPVIEVNWFNVHSGKMEKAAIPAMQINVRAGVSSINEPILPQVTPDVNAPTQPQPQPTVSANEQPQIVEIEAVKTNHFYIFLGLAFVLGIIISALLMHLFSRKKGEPHIRNYKKYIIEKAKEKDLRALRDGILGWAQQHYKNESLKNLKEVGELTGNQEFECELEKLTEALYARTNQDWQSGSFIKVFEKVYAKKYRKKKENEPLPKLYK